LTNKTRMHAEDRKRAIINAAKPLFAKNGFNGVSVMEIAKAAGVSKALLYRHFPSKDEMYKDILEYSGRLTSLALKGFENHEVGTQAFIHYVHKAFYSILFEIPGEGDDQKVYVRLVYYSLLEDISFAKMVFEKIYDSSSELIETCYKAGIKSGDIIKIDIPLLNCYWFAHHLAMGLNMCLLSDEPAFAYEGSKKEMIDQAIQFTLRGIGVTEKAIKKYLKSENKMDLVAKIRGE